MPSLRTKRFFGLSEVNFAHVPGGPTSKQIAQILRVRDAVYHILTGDTFTGKSAAEIGFVILSVPIQNLEEKVAKIAKKLCQTDPWRV